MHIFWVKKRLIKVWARSFFFFFFCEKGKTKVVISGLSCKTVLPPVLFFCNLNLSSPLALGHGLNSLGWHPYFLGERQVWPHSSSREPNSLFLPPHRACNPLNDTDVLHGATHLKKKAKAPRCERPNLPGHSRKPVAAEASRSPAGLFCPLATAVCPEIRSGSRCWAALIREQRGARRTCRGRAGLVLLWERGLGSLRGCLLVWGGLC